MEDASVRVLVTGGTGFVGSHSVKALLDAGHELRLSVRSRDRVANALAPLGIDSADTRIEVLEGDVTDASHVEEALRGCDAVLHAASMYTFDVRQAKTMRRTNVEGTENVLSTAARLGLDPIVHVSSTVALAGRKGEVLSHESDLGTGRGAYSGTKVDSEEIARRLQVEGAPVVITNPSAVSGPHDLHVGETCIALRGALRGMMAVGVRGRIPFCDVRDVAAVHAAVVEPGRGARRYMVPGHAPSVADILGMLHRLTGHRLPGVRLPWRLVAPGVHAADALQHIAPGRLPLSSELVRYITYHHDVDASRTIEELGVTARSFEASVRDTVLWMVAAGHLKPGLAGELAAEVPATP
ncbi:MAG: SDR family NAD(P)-dependent oxidoreductase [Dehalococcoidia bacterium]|nr:SDR family NAD(P)-dependent oxidoreductase [Dehalococcoidia bacterium]